MSSTRDRILDIAEAGMRRGGFDAVSFRDIAAEIGIKSASVHYHFPRKSDLGAAAVRRYADRFLDSLGAPGAEAPETQAARLAGAYRGSFGENGSACLCAVLGAASPGLPEEVRAEVGRFFARQVDWTEQALRTDRGTAAAAVAKLQGGMVLSLALGDPEPLDAAAREVEAVSA